MKLAKLANMLIVGCISMFSLNAAKEQPSTKATAEANNKFGFDLYSKLKIEDGNIFFSPYSISNALGMTYAGANGETEKQIAKVLHFTGGQEQTCKSFGEMQEVLNEIQDKENVKLSIANSIWAKENYKFLPSYMDLVQKDYKSKINMAPFSNMGNCEKTRKEINAWVEDKTNDKIKELIKRGMIEPLTRMVLVNAIYFKGDWATQFKKEATNKKGTFYTAVDKKVTVPMMYQKEKFKFAEDDSTLLLELPYKGNETSMVILLPKEIDGIEALEKSISFDYLQDILKKIKKQKVHVYLPKFKIETDYLLADTLKEMGMQDACTPGKADFSGMSGNKDMSISFVIHKAFVEVDEKGTEAAAATAVIMQVESISINRPPIFKADHPFIYLIRENSTGGILFMGRMSNPEK